MRILLACTCLTPIVFAAGTASLRAEQVISTARTTPIATGTSNNGAPDDVRITSAGSIKLTSGVAVTIDSDDDARNEGTIEIRNANDSAGIVAQAGRAGNITNTGTITIDETYEAADADNDKDADGPFAQGARRFGIRVLPGGTFTGNVTHSGTILVEGNQSAGIAIDSRLAGNLSSTGRIGVLGDEAVGIRAGDVSGNVYVSNAIVAQGRDAVGVALDGDIGGGVVIQGSVASTGYRYSTPPGKVEDLDADDLLQGGPAVRISGNVAGGILLDVPPPDRDPNDADEDKDGIPDAQEGTAAIVSSGAAAAIQVGDTTENIAIGAVAGTANGGNGFVIKGTAVGNGIYAGVDANGVVIGGLGGAVDVAGGLSVQGGIGASSNGGNATALRIGSGATVPALTNSGVISAIGGKALESRVAAVQIDAGAQMTSLTNSGRIAAESNEKGSATAIRDNAGTLALVTNSGAIAATVKSTEASAVAIDLRANASGATVRQAGAVEADRPSIAGNILFGAGADTLEVSKGSIAGTTDFGAGANRLAMSGASTYNGAVRFGAGDDRMSLDGTSSFSGELDFGGGSDRLDIGGTARLSALLAGSQGLAVAVNGGTLDLTNKGDVTLSSLAVTGNGAIGVSIDGAAGTHTRYVVNGAASFAEGSKIVVHLANIRESEGDYVVIDAGSLTGGANLAPDAAALPFLYKGAISSDVPAGEVTLSIQRKSTAELGLNRSQSQAFDAIYDVLDNDARMAGVFLGIADAGAFNSAVRQMLPDHAGGVFEAVTQGSRATARFLADPDFAYAEKGGVGFWLQQVAWGSSKSIGDTSSYDITGWGATGGADVALGGLGRAGFTLAYLTGRDEEGGTDNQVTTSQYELGVHWRGSWGGAQAFARASAAAINLDGVRSFEGMVGTETVQRSTEGEWSGRLVSAMGGLAYEFGSGRLSLRPMASIDYYRLSEDGYSETGGGKAFDLIVEDRTSDEFAANATLTVGYDLARGSADQAQMRVELEGGRRQIIGGALGRTVARFEDGETFTLDPEARTDGWLGRLRLMGGLAGFMVGGEFSAEEQHDHLAIALRASLRLGF